MRKIKIIPILMAFVMITSSCSNKTIETDSKIKPMKSVSEVSRKDYEKLENDNFHDKIQDLRYKIYDFSTEFFKTYKKNSSGENSLFSPLSFYYAFSALTEGADGSTKAELLKLLKQESMESLRDSINLHKIYLSGKNENDDKILVSDSIWIDDKFRTSIKDTFLDNTSDKHFSEIFSEDLQKHSTKKGMEDWVEEKTNHLIKPDIQISSDTVMFLLNTIYFKSEWEDEFKEENNYEDKFYLANGSKRDVQYMSCSVNNQYYIQDEYASTSYLRFKNGTKFMAILPNTGISIDTILQKDLLRKYSSFQDSKNLVKINWHVPIFDFKNEIDLKEELSSMGYTEIFDMENANFTNMYDKDKYIYNIYVGSARQLNNLKLNNKGVEATSYTEIQMKEEGFAEPNKKEISFKLNRPFIYVISDPYDIPIFIGVFEKPNK